MACADFCQPALSQGFGLMYASRFQTISINDVTLTFIRATNLQSVRYALKLISASNMFSLICPLEQYMPEESQHFLPQ